MTYPQPALIPRIPLRSQVNFLDVGDSLFAGDAFVNARFAVGHERFDLSLKISLGFV